MAPEDIDTSRIEKENNFILGFINRKRVIIIEPEIAEIIGVPEAMILNQIKFWCGLANNTNIYEGRPWVYRTLNEWHDEIKCISVSTIRRSLDNLKSRGLILTANFNKDRTDRTIWYSPNYPIDFPLAEQPNAIKRKGLNSPLSEKNDIPSFVQNEQMDLSKMNNSTFVQNEQMIKGEEITEEKTLRDNNKVVSFSENFIEDWDEIKSVMLWHGLSEEYFLKCKESRSIGYMIDKINYVTKRTPTKAAGYLRKAIEDDYREGISSLSVTEKKIYTRDENAKWYKTLTEDDKRIIHDKVVDEWLIFEHMYNNNFAEMCGNNLITHPTFKDVMRIIGRPEE